MRKSELMTLVCVSKSELIDSFPVPLCKTCFHWYLEGGDPYEPNAIDRSAEYLWKIFKLHATEVMVNVASFLHHWTEP